MLSALKALLTLGLLLLEVVNKLLDLVKAERQRAEVKAVDAEHKKQIEKIDAAIDGPAKDAKKPDA